MRIEKQEDYDQYHRRMLNTSIAERSEKGITWYPLQLIRSFIGTGDRVVVEVERTRFVDQNHLFQVGAVVALHSNQGGDLRELSVNGVISRIRGNQASLVLNQTDFPDWLQDGRLGMDLMFDEATYREMEHALKKVIKATTGRLFELKQLFYGLKSPSFRSGHDFQSIKLNPRQNEALTQIFNAEDIALVHGPPGTGKTTTLVSAIKEVALQEKQVLVCAPSNAAVDLLVEKLAEQGVSVLRLGHPARVAGSAVENSLDHKIAQHGLYKELKSIRAKAEEMKKLALKYKRKYGHQERKQRRLILNESRTLKSEADQIEHYITRSLVDGAAVIACTLVGSSHSLIANRTFQTLFIDEAAQSLEPACWIPILKARRVVMAGDHFQLPPTVKSFEAAKNGLERTLFEKTIQRLPQAVMLNRQYRMHPQIMSFPSGYFYEHQLEADESVLSRPDFYSEKPLEFIDSAGCGFTEKVNQETLSTYNEGEGDLLVKHLCGLLDRIGLETVMEDGLTIAVIVPYKAQIEYLREIWEPTDHHVALGKRVSINTVDAFQGQERDIIYMGMVRSNDKGEIGFLKEIRRTNVAMTRAKRKLVIFGDSATLSINSFYDQLVDYAQQLEAYRSAFELIYES